MVPVVAYPFPTSFICCVLHIDNTICSPSLYTDLLGDLEQLAEPDIYYEAMKGVRNLVSMFLAVGKNRLGENVSQFLLINGVRCLTRVTCRLLALQMATLFCTSLANSCSMLRTSTDRASSAVKLRPLNHFWLCSLARVTRTSCPSTSPRSIAVLKWYVHE